MRADVAIPGVRPAVRCVKNAEHHQSPRATRRCPRCHEYAGSAFRSARHPARIVRSPGGGNAAAHSPQQVRRRGLLARRPRTRRGAVLQLPQRRTLRRVRRKSTLRPGDSGALHGSCEVLVEGMLLRTLHSKFADAAFSLAGLELAEARSFSFLSGGRSAVYGVNLPCDQVILALDASTTSSETQSRGRRCGDPPSPSTPCAGGTLMEE